MSIKTFRGLMTDGEQRRIRLGTTDGLVGYKIIKFQNIQHQPGNNLIEGVMKVWSVKQTTIDALVNFEAPTLLAVCYHEDNDSTAYSTSQVIIIDEQKFNQDIYITFKDVSTGESMNYYLELERFKLDLNEATVATLKDMRGRE